MLIHNKMRLFLKFKLAQEFGFGKEARAKKKEFLKDNGGFKGLRKTFAKEGLDGFKKKVSSFKDGKPGRPGQNDHLIDNKKGEKPKAKDGIKPDANKEWDKKSEDKLSKIKDDPKQFKRFESDNKADAIKEVNEAIAQKDITKLRGIVDKAFPEKDMSSQDKLAAFGFAKKEDLVLSGKADDKGVFALFKASDTKKPFAQVTIGEKADFQLELAKEENNPQKPSPNETNSQE